MSRTTYKVRIEKLNGDGAVARVQSFNLDFDENTFHPAQVLRSVARSMEIDQHVGCLPEDDEDVLGWTPGILDGCMHVFLRDARDAWLGNRAEGADENACDILPGKAVGAWVWVRRYSVSLARL